MEELFSNAYNLIISTIDSIGIYGPLLGSLFIILESIIPPLPLFVFITINFVAFGDALGFLISWICTCMGCFISYFLIKKLFKDRVVKRIKKRNLLGKCMNYFKNLSLTKITIILSIPFTPAFMMNITAGLVNMDFKKFAIAIIISKIFLVYFWGYVGTGLLESLNNPESLVTVILMILIAYILSVITRKVFNID